MYSKSQLFFFRGTAGSGRRSEFNGSGFCCGCFCLSVTQSFHSHRAGGLTLLPSRYSPQRFTITLRPSSFSSSALHAVSFPPLFFLSLSDRVLQLNIYLHCCLVLHHCMCLSVRWRNSDTIGRVSL